jgi:cephalosporin-C deacetylase
VNEPIRVEEGLFLVHQSGRALGVPGPVNVEQLRLPNNEKHLALTFPCKGHAANSFNFTAYPSPRGSRLLVFPKREISVKNGTEALYTSDSEITYTLNFDWLAKKPLEGHVEIEFKHALGKKTGYIKKEITEEMRTGTKYSVSLNPQPTVPGVQEIWARLIADNGEILSSHRDRVMYDWQHFEPEYNTPDDMKQFWTNTLSEMRKLPLNAEIKRVYKDHPEWKLYHVSYDAWEGQRIHACMMFHKEAELPLPVKIGTHPGTSGFGIKKTKEGLYGSKIKADKRFLSITPLIRGHKPDADDIPFNHPWWGDIVERDEYVARNWYCALPRALDFLETQPDLADMSLIITRGGSQGGALAVVTAALDERVSACLADSPSNSMLHYSVDPKYYKSFGPTAGQTPEGWTLAEFKDMLAYYDPANMAPWIKCPTVIGVTTGDLTVHSMGGLGIYKNLTTLEDDQKWFLPSTHISNRHSNSRRGSQKMKALIKQLLQKRVAE